MPRLLKRLFSAQALLPKSGAQGEVPSTKEAYMNLLRIALPSVCEMVLISLMGSIDTMMVGGIGTEAIAAVGLVGQPRMLMLCMFFAMNTGITAVVARRKGQGDREDANRTLRTSLLIIFLMSLVMTVVGQLVARPLMRLAGGDKAESEKVLRREGRYDR